MNIKPEPILSRRDFLALGSGALAWSLVMRPMAAEAAVKAGKGAKPGSKPLEEDHHLQISNEDRCPVCGMKPIAYPKFSCGIQMTDGTTFYFCGNGCMIRSWVDPEKFLQVEKEALSFVTVRDYFTGNQIDGRTAVWVSGSDVVGPMGRTPVPLREDADVKTFMDRHGGNRKFRLSELTNENIGEILEKRPR